MSKTAYLSLGSNLGDRSGHLKRALELLPGEKLRVLRVSPVYETDPVDYTAQDRFLNLVVEVETVLFPRQLLKHVQDIERQMGRKRLVARGPRNIDIDILLYGRFVVQAPDLIIPHPRLHERRFALEPLADLAPDFRHPVFRKTVREMLGKAMDQRSRRTGLNL